MIVMKTQNILDDIDLDNKEFNNNDKMHQLIQTISTYNRKEKNSMMPFLFAFITIMLTITLALLSLAMMFNYQNINDKQVSKIDQLNYNVSSIIFNFNYQRFFLITYSIDELLGEKGLEWANTIIKEYEQNNNVNPVFLSQQLNSFSKIVHERKCQLIISWLGHQQKCRPFKRPILLLGRQKK